MASLQLEPGDDRSEAVVVDCLVVSSWLSVLLLNRHGSVLARKLRFDDFLERICLLGSSLDAWW